MTETLSISAPSPAIVMQICRSCYIPKPLKEFRKLRSKDGTKDVCKGCEKTKRELNPKKKESVQKYFYRIMTQAGYFITTKSKHRTMIFETPKTKKECDEFLIWLKEVIKELRGNYFTNSPENE